MVRLLFNLLLNCCIGFAIIEALGNRTVPLSFLDVRTNCFEHKDDIVKQLRQLVNNVVVDMGLKHNICDGLQEV